ncbi:hypothetical protein ASM1NWU_21 [Enterococcus phage AS-M1_NWU]|nr:hypothetical protein ASM1NWU_21 [Enterococcus phage AS-M1_NWU]
MSENTNLTCLRCQTFLCIFNRKVLIDVTRGFPSAGEVFEVRF